MDNCDGYLPSRQEYKARKRECEIMAQVEKLEQEIAGMSDAEMRIHLSGQPQSVIHKMPDNVRYLVYNEAERKGRLVKPVMIALKIGSSSIILDGYNIGGYTYFKIGDIAYAMIHQNKSFSASWDNINHVWYLSSDTRYTPVKGDAVTGGITYTTGKYETPSVNKDGTNISLGCYRIGENHYFKLRDIGRVFDFYVYWDGTNVRINPELPYQAEAAA